MLENEEIPASRIQELVKWSQATALMLGIPLMRRWPKVDEVLAIGQGKDGVFIGTFVRVWWN